ncbi:MAG: glycoside hydrolase family 13 protein [Deinococcales bacterium]
MTASRHDSPATAVGGGDAYHDWEPFCVEPLRPELGETVRLAVRTASTEGWLLVEHHGELVRTPLRRVDGGLEARVAVHASPLRYVFRLPSGYLGSHGSEPVLPRFDRFFHLLAEPTVPEWAVGAVVYHIFPDRFRRGSAEPAPASGAWDFDGHPIIAKVWNEPPDPRRGQREIYGGDLWGVIEALDDLQDLGVEALYLTPIFRAESSHRYDTLDYLHVDPALGGEAAFDALLEALHGRGMRLVLDGVFNHAGHRHPDFLKALEDPASPQRDMFTFRPGGGYAAFFDVRTLPKIDYGSPLARERFLEGAHAPVRYWLRRGIDGWRLDVAHQIGEGGTARGNRALLRTIHRTAREENSEAYVFGELSYDTVPTLRAHTLDGSMHYAGFAHPLMTWLCGRDVHGEPVTTSAARTWQALWDHYAALPLSVRQTMLTLLSSHDVPRALWRLRGDTARFKLAYGVLLAFPGSPSIYYGDEIGMSQANAYEDFRGDPMCRATFPWDRSAWDDELLGFVRSMIRLRRDTPALRRGGLAPLPPGRPEAGDPAYPPQVLAFRRCYQGDEVWVFAAPEPATVRLPAVRDLLADDRPVQGERALHGLALFRPHRRPEVA